MCALHRSVVCLLLGALISLNVGAAEVAGVHFDDTAQVADSELVLNGAGLRSKFFFKVYAMALYLPQKADSAQSVLNNSGPMRIEMVMLRDLSADQLTEALIEGLQKNLSRAELDTLATRIETLRTVMAALGSAPEKTQIRIDYLPAKGTRLYFNNVQKGTDIAGEDFFQALLRIWLGEKPAQEDLRAKLLGK